MKVAIAPSRQTAYWRKVINKIIPALGCIFIMLLVVFLPALTTAQTQPERIAPQTQPEQSRREQGSRVINKLTGRAGQPVLNALRQNFPFLADAIVDYSLGEVWSRQGLDDRTRQLATVAAFAAAGNLPQLKIHAGYALRLGVTQDELKEIIYLTTVTAGFPRSIDAAQAMGEVFTVQ
ncbi:carboxymuconolactone decarboxylase family protein [Nostocales cyanobacterium LEGE 11386]|nr:carboxymuconolactone decarboxylase family protein [Nostocales cyanobacterium LEGE 11386]